MRCAHMRPASRSLLENTAITIGRLGMAAPEQTATHLETYALPWLLSLRNIRDDIEKVSAAGALAECRFPATQGPLSNQYTVC